MKRKKRSFCLYRMIGMVLGLNMVVTAAAVAQRKPVPNAVTTQISEHFHNIFVHEFVDMLVFSGPEGLLLVDTGMEPADLIQRAVAEISMQPVRYIINTHLNGDHVRGNAAFGREPVIIAHRICRDQIARFKNFPAEGIPRITFDKAMTLHFNGEEILLRHMPGHTGGDILVYFKKAGIACVGDLIFADSFPGVQVDNGGDAFVLEQTMAELVRMLPQDVKIINSHGRDYSWQDLKAYHEMIQKTLQIIKPLVDRGMTLEEIKAGKPLASFLKWNSQFFPGEITTETWIAEIVESLVSAEKKQD